MNKEEIKELFNKYGVKDLKDKNGQSECFNCKNIKHRFSLTWTSFLYEYKEKYYCFDCLLTILLQQENNQLKEQRQELRSWLEEEINKGGSSIDLAIRIHTFCKVLDKLNELEGGKNE